MSEKIVYGMCTILVVILIMLVICERMYPEGGEMLLQSFM